MKLINNYISEKLQISSKGQHYKYHPKTKKELVKIIEQRIEKEGPECDLNDIDVSEINDMSVLFYGSDFNGDISKWNVSNVKNMEKMFAFSKFNQDISNWDISKVKNMSYMFYNCPKFEGIGLEKWDMSNVEDICCMFAYSNNIDIDVSNWKLSKIKRIDYAFYNCKKFTGKGTEKWNIDIDKTYVENAFDGCVSMKKIPEWYEQSRPSWYI